MPNLKQAKKRMRQDAKRRLANRAVKSSLKSHIKRTQRAVADRAPEAAQRELAAAIHRLDKAAQKGIINQNAAARKKSRLARQVNGLK